MMNRYIYALFGLCFLLSCQKSQSDPDLGKHPVNIMLFGNLATEEVLPTRSDISNITDLASLERLELSCSNK